MAIDSWFPHLKDTGYTITSPATEDYNCIAWAAREDDRWWWPDPLGTSYWPENASREVTLNAFLAAFSTLGFESCFDSQLEPGFEKIAIYINADGEPSHISRQLNNGRWTSKLGKSFDIEHAFDGLNNSQYGSIAHILRRRIQRDST